jgi:diadenosine tetraphosphate (Ap4A) HIT family hydrolase
MNQPRVPPFRKPQLGSFRNICSGSPIPTENPPTVHNPAQFGFVPQKATTAPPSRFFFPTILIMKRVRFPILLSSLLGLCTVLGHADVRGCVCDLARPETMQARECGLCRLVEQQTGDQPFFFTKDINPTKPNRLLILPRKHYPGPHSLAEMSPEERTAYWTAAITKAQELWGDAWGVAANADSSRTQCHTHMHIGKLLPDVETDSFTVVDGPAAIPVPADNGGLWIHPVNGKLHVHFQATAEPVLMR